MNCLANFTNDAKKALEERNFRISTELWRKHLSERFPLGEDTDDISNSFLGLGSLILSTTKPYGA